MMLTEEEAKQRWCPFARVLLPVHQAGNRISTFHKQHATGADVEYYAQQERDCNCIGSKCMAWRWAGYYPVDGGRNDEAHGYCGLAGKPE